MADDKPTLPPELLRALQEGERIAKLPVSPDISKTLEHLKNMTAEERAEMFKKAGELTRDMIEETHRRDAEVAKFAGQPQTFEVHKDFSFWTSERHIGGRHIEVADPQKVRYNEGQPLLLTPTLLILEIRDRTESLWVWRDTDGWIMREWRRRVYMHRNWLKACN